MENFHPLVHFPLCNSVFFILCLDLAQYVVRVMSARAQADTLQGFYMQIALTF